MANLKKPSGVNNIWASSGVRTDPGAAKAVTGWVVELPPYQTANWIEYRQDAFIAHVNQHGIADWDSTTEYQGDISYTKVGGIIYKCKVTNTNIDPSNPLNSNYWVRAFESYGAAAVVQAALDKHLTNYSTLSGVSNTTVARTNLSVYSKSESDARYAAIAGSASRTFQVATATSSAHAIPLGQLQSLLTQATEAKTGIAKIATNAEVAEGKSDTAFITPLKAATVYLAKTGNLSGLGNVATARSNLGLGSIATMSDTLFLKVSNNLSDVPNKATARSNLGLTSTAIQPETYFLRTSQCLAEIPDKALARDNLGLQSTAITPLSGFMLKAENLSGLADVSEARRNLGLGSAALSSTDQFMQPSKNLSDVSNVQSARNNLGLGSASVMDVFGVKGNLDFTSSIGTSSGYFRLPNGIKMAYGRFSLAAAPGASQNVNFGTSFSTILSITVTPYNAATEQIGYTNYSTTMMTLQKGIEDFSARTGMWMVWGV